MGEHYQVRSCSWSRTPKRCSAEGITDEFILVDDDDVIILDFPESSRLKPSDASRNQSESSLLGVISIDDDDDEDDDDEDDNDDNNDTDNAQKPGNRVEGVSDDPGSVDPNQQTLACGDDDDCQVIQEKCSAFRFSKCKQTFSKKASHRNRFGLGSESEGGLSDSDSSDCEVLEGPNSKVREQWEKAFLRKRHKTGKATHDLCEKASHSDIPCDGNSDIGDKNRNEQHGQTSSFASRNSDAGKERSSLFPNGDGSFHAPSFGFAMYEGKKNNASSSGENNIPEPSSQPDETRVEHEGFSGKEYSGVLKEVGEEPKKVHVQHEMSASALSKKNHTKKAVHQSGTKETREEFAITTESSPSVAQTSHAGRDTTSVLSIQGDEVRVEDETPSLNGIGEPIFDSAPSTSAQVSNDHGAPEINVMLDREKMKETDEYKRAAEEEWQSRQRQLQIQAEEAQRQRKKIKLENMRRLEMERRQKERLEEMRENQKKDEESMNMKEKVRAEVSVSLKRLEIMCMDMASLLRGLGIPVGGGSLPLSDEVHAAYKRALLKFHPDRARGNLRQQVEAEEKFKLIARMKDKFQSTSFAQHHSKQHTSF